MEMIPASGALWPLRMIGTYPVPWRASSASASLTMAGMSELRFSTDLSTTPFSVTRLQSDTLLPGARARWTSTVHTMFPGDIGGGVEFVFAVAAFGVDGPGGEEGESCGGGDDADPAAEAATIAAAAAAAGAAGAAAVADDGDDDDGGE